MCRQLVLAVLLAAIAAANASYYRTAKYDGQMVVKCHNVSRDQYSKMVSQPGVDVWAVDHVTSSVDVRIGGADHMMLLARLGLTCVPIKDVERLVRGFEETMYSKQQATWFEEYHQYDEIVKWYEELADRFSDLVTYVPTIGSSIEGRDMPAVHITSKKDTNSFKIYFQCQIHAREWISSAVCGYVASFLLENYGTNEEVTELLDSLEFIFIPFVNPDGYVETWNGDRLWRKNMRKGTGGCDGVDLNRNYNDHWGEGGSSSNPCSETYRGASAESEPETKNTANYFKSSPAIIGAIDWHSFSQLILRPYGWTSTDSPDEARLKSIGDEMSSITEKVHGKYYTSQKSIGLYITTGTASDWFYSADANLDNDGYRAAGYTIELRDTGLYGFLLPPDQIIPNGEEIVPAVLYYAKNLLEDPLKM